MRLDTVRENMGQNGLTVDRGGNSKEIAKDRSLFAGTSFFTEEKASDTDAQKVNYRNKRQQFTVFLLSYRLGYS